MTSLTIITPAQPTRIAYLRHLGKSLNEYLVPLQEEGTLSRIVWRIQVDGVDDLPTPETVLPAGSPIRSVVAHNGKQYGAAITRNIALGEVDTDLVWAVDDDDAVTQYAGDLVDTLNDAPSEYAFAIAGNLIPVAKGWGETTELDDLTEFRWSELAELGGFEETGWTSWSPRLPFSLPRRAIREYTRRRDGLFPCLGTCTLYRTAAVRDVGGYPATPTREDAAMLTAVSDRYQGLTLALPVLVYRQHGDQNTAHPHHEHYRALSNRMMQDRNGMRSPTTHAHCGF
jgi:hypothetical protein